MTIPSFIPRTFSEKPSKSAEMSLSDMLLGLNLARVRGSIKANHRGIIRLSGDFLSKRSGNEVSDLMALTSFPHPIFQKNRQKVLKCRYPTCYSAYIRFELYPLKQQTTVVSFGLATIFCRFKAGTELLVTEYSTV
jgi:hypothetical protein